MRVLSQLMNKCKHLVINLLIFLNFLDENNNLSITNLLLIAIAIKVLYMPAFDITEMVALAGALINYGHKRYINNSHLSKKNSNQEKEDNEINELKSSISLINENVSKLSLAIGLKKQGE